MFYIVLQTIHLILFNCFQNMPLADEYCQVSVFWGTHSKAEEK